MLLSLLALAPLSSPEDAAPAAAPWPCWRGPERDGVSRESGWSPRGKAADLWRRDVGYGYSCASIADGRLFTLGFDVARNVDVVWCLDPLTGEVRWSDEYPGELRDLDHTGGTLTTPTVDAGRVYVTSTLGGLRCYEAESGRLLWSKDVARLHDAPPGYYGFGASPVVVGELLLVAMDKVLALDKARGDLVWETEAKNAQYSTPAPFRLGDVASLAVFTQDGLEVLEQATGAQRSFYPWKNGERRVNASTPVIVGERVFLSSAYEHGCALIEFGESGAKASAVWSSRAMRNKMAGCVLVDGHLYGFDESMLKCLNLEGEELWRLRGLGNGSLIGAPGRLLTMSSSGELIVAEASPQEFKELSRAQVFEDGVFWSPPVLADGLVYCRSSLGELVCRDHRAAETEEAPAATAATEAELPQAAALFEQHLAAIGGAEALRRHSSVRMKGIFEMRSVGFVPVAMEIDWSVPNLWRCRFDLPPPREGDIQRVFDGQLGFEVNFYRGHSLFPEATCRELAETRAFHGAATWREDHASMRTVGAVEFDGRACWKVETASRSGAKRTVYFERETGLLAGREGADESTVAWRDYREADGQLVPRLEKHFVPGTGIEETFRIESLEFDVVDPQAYARPPEIQALVESQGR